MILTSDEQAMLKGREGVAKQKAMELLVKYGEALGAERMVNTNNVFGGVVAPIPFVRKFAAKVKDIDSVFSEFNLDSGNRVTIPQVKVFTCSFLNSLDPDYWQMMGANESTYKLQMRMEKFCRRIGINLTNTCAPYLVGNVPVKGEHCAWLESSAVVYCNSVLGARTNTEGWESTGAAMLVGKIPYWGYHIDENRLGIHLVNVDINLNSVMDWNLLGYYIGELVQEQVPVFKGVRSIPNLNELKSFGVALASSGGTEMYHIVGITPEAYNINEAFGNKKPVTTLYFGKSEREKAYNNLNSAKDQNVDFVTLGCPHYSIEEVWEVCKLLKGKYVSTNTNLWIFMSRPIKALADRNGYTEIITNAGGYIMTDTCPVYSQLYPKDTKVVATDSAKQAHYTPAVMGFETWYGSLDDCIQAAISGEWRGELK